MVSIRSENLKTDAGLLAAQGFIGSWAINFVSGYGVINPFLGALIGVVYSVTDRIFNPLSEFGLPEVEVSFGPVTVELRSLVTRVSGLYTSMTVLQLVGIMAPLPALISTIGMISLGIVIGGAVIAFAKEIGFGSEASLQEKMHRVMNGHIHRNEVISIHWGERCYSIRVINNKTVSHIPKPYIIACRDNVPPRLESHIKRFIPHGADVLLAVNGEDDYFDSLRGM